MIAIKSPGLRTALFHFFFLFSFYYNLKKRRKRGGGGGGGKPWLLDEANSS